MNAKKPKKGRYHLGKLFGGSFSPKKSYICHCLATLLQDNNSAVVDKPDECEYIFTILYSCCCVEKRERASSLLLYSWFSVERMCVHFHGKKESAREFSAPIFLAQCFNLCVLQSLYNLNGTLDFNSRNLSNFRELVRKCCSTNISFGTCEFNIDIYLPIYKILYI